jgi:hypothetical protein
MGFESRMTELAALSILKILSTTARERAHRDYLQIEVSEFETRLNGGWRKDGGGVSGTDVADLRCSLLAGYLE